MEIIFSTYNEKAVIEISDKKRIKMYDDEMLEKNVEMHINIDKEAIEIINNESMATDLMFAPLYILVLAILVVIVCFLAYLCDERQRRVEDRMSCIRCDLDTPPTYQALFFSQPPPDYGTLGQPPQYGTIV